MISVFRVNGLLKDQTWYWISYKQELLFICATAGPRVVVSPESQTIQVGQNGQDRIILDCRVEGDPRALVSLSFDFFFTGEIYNIQLG